MLPTEACTFRLATADDAPPLARLVNSAFTGDSGRAGWTNEMHLVTGLHTQAAEINELIDSPKNLMLICLVNDELAGSVLLQRRAGGTHLAMFVVKPTLQGAGLGTGLLRAAEALSQRLWGSRRTTLTAITLRSELIEFYKRRGYRLTGEFFPVPTVGRVHARVPGIEVAVLQRELQSPAGRQAAGADETPTDSLATLKALRH